MNKNKKLITFLSILSILAIPAILLAAKIEIGQGTTISNTGLIRVKISNYNPKDLKLKAEYGEKKFEIQSSMFSFDEEGNGSATMPGLRSGVTYKYRLFDTADLLAPTDIFTFTFVGGSSAYYVSYPFYNSPSSPSYEPNFPPSTHENPASTPTDASTPAPDTNTGIPITLGTSATMTSGGGQNNNAQNISAPRSSSFSAAGSDQGLIPCGRNTEDADPATKHQCGFSDLMKLINNIINFIFKFLALPIAALMFAYAGVLMVTSAGSTESRSKAKTIFTNTALGLIIALAAWLIVNSLLIILGYTDIDLFF